MRLCNQSLEYVGGIVAYFHTLQIKRIIGIHLISCFVPPDGCQFNISQSPTVSIYSFVLSRCCWTVLFLFLFSVWVDSDVSSALIIMHRRDRFIKRKWKWQIRWYFPTDWWLFIELRETESSCRAAHETQHRPNIKSCERLHMRRKCQRNRGEREWVNHWHLHFFFVFLLFAGKDNPFHTCCHALSPPFFP